MDVIELIKNHEGFRRFPYRCTANKLTIGYGRNIEDTGVTEAEAHYLLLNDIKRLENYFKKTDWYNGLSLARKAVIIDMAFNLGISGFLKFKKMIAAIEEHQYLKASEEMLNSVWAVQVKDRAIELAYMMENDSYR